MLMSTKLTRQRSIYVYSYIQYDAHKKRCLAFSVDIFCEFRFFGRSRTIPSATEPEPKPRKQTEENEPEAELSNRTTAVSSVRLRPGLGRDSVAPKSSSGIGNHGEAPARSFAGAGPVGRTHRNRLRATCRVRSYQH